MEDLQHEQWSSFGGAKSIAARDLNSTHVGKEIAVMVGSAAVMGPLTKLTHIQASGWEEDRRVKLTVGYDGDAFKVKTGGDADIYLLEIKSQPSAPEVPV